MDAKNAHSDLRRFGRLTSKPRTRRAEQDPRVELVEAEQGGEEEAHPAVLRHDRRAEVEAGTVAGGNSHEPRSRPAAAHQQLVGSAILDFPSRECVYLARCELLRLSIRRRSPRQPGKKQPLELEDQAGIESL